MFEQLWFGWSWRPYQFTLEDWQEWDALRPSQRAEQERFWEAYANGEIKDESNS